MGGEISFCAWWDWRKRHSSMVSPLYQNTCKTSTFSALVPVEHAAEWNKIERLSWRARTCDAALCPIGVGYGSPAIGKTIQFKKTEVKNQICVKLGPLHSLSLPGMLVSQICWYSLSLCLNAPFLVRPFQISLLKIAILTTPYTCSLIWHVCA